MRNLATALRVIAIVGLGSVGGGCLMLSRSPGGDLGDVMTDIFTGVIVGGIVGGIIAAVVVRKLR